MKLSEDVADVMADEAFIIADGINALSEGKRGGALLAGIGLALGYRLGGASEEMLDALLSLIRGAALVEMNAKRTDRSHSGPGVTVPPGGHLLG
jgi:hypothetical protein